jgi:hypothetical protein
VLEFTATVGAYTSVVVMAFSALTHFFHLPRFRGQLARQEIWPRGLEWPVAAFSTLVEFILGIGALALLLWGRVAMIRVGLAATATLYGLYFIFGAYLQRRNPTAPCGCSATDHEINVWVKLRALALASTAGFGSVAAPWILPPAFTQEFATVIPASLALGIVLWNLPTAMHSSPSRSRLYLSHSGEGVR